MSTSSHHGYRIDHAPAGADLDVATDDAHGLYRQFGFAPLAKPDVYMEKRRAPASSPAPLPAET